MVSIVVFMRYSVEFDRLCSESLYHAMHPSCSHLPLPTLVIISSTHNLLARRPQYKSLRPVSPHPILSHPTLIFRTYMFTLRRITPLNIAQRRIRLNNASTNQIIQAQQILVVSQTVQISPTERQCAKVLCDTVEQSFCGGDAQGDFGRVAAFGVV